MSISTPKEVMIDSQTHFPRYQCSGLVLCAQFGACDPLDYKRWMVELKSTTVRVFVDLRSTAVFELVEQHE